MIEKIRDLGKQTAVYGFGSILNKVLGFILIPVYQSHIPIGEFGHLVYFETIILFLTAFFNYGVAVGHQRFFYLEKEKGTYGIFLFNNFIGSLWLSVFSILPLLLFSGELAQMLVGSKDQSVNLQITLGIIVVEILYVLPLQVLQYEKKAFSYLSYNALKLIISFATTIYFVINLDMGITGFLTARLIGVSIVIIIAVFHIIIPRCTFAFSKHALMQSLRFGFPHVISTLGYTVFSITDRFMLNWLSTPEELGKYGFGFRIANFINLIFVQTIGMSYFPSIMNNEKEVDNIRYYRKMLTYYSFLIGFLILGFLFFYRDLLWIVVTDKNYWAGLDIVPLLSLSFMIMGMNYFVQAGLFLKNKTQYYLIPSSLAVPINIGLNMFLIPRYGMTGAAISVVVAQITYTSVLTLMSGKFMKVHYEWNKILLVFVVGIIIFLGVNLIELPNIFLQLLFKFLLLALFPVILYFLGFFEIIEIVNIKKGIRTFLSKLRGV